MATSFLFQPHLHNRDGTVITPDIAIDRVVVADFSNVEPRFHPVTIDRLTTNTEVQQLGITARGSASVVLLAAGSGTMVGLGSDHLDPGLGGANAHQACVKPLCRDVWRYDDVADHWDKLDVNAAGAVRSTNLGGAPPAADIVRAFTDSDELPRGMALFLSGFGQDGEAGTNRFSAELADPVLDRRLTLSYTIQILANEG